MTTTEIQTLHIIDTNSADYSNPELGNTPTTNYLNNQSFVDLTKSDNTDQMVTFWLFFSLLTFGKGDF
jgi:hypothetical protein